MKESRKQTRDQEAYKPSQPRFLAPMASVLLSPFVKLFTFSIALLLCFPNGVDAIPESELEAALSAMRSNGYNLFGNAIVTSDLRYDVLAGTSFTFFAPTDGALFALDMIAPASLYVSTLRYHVVLRRLSISDLRSIRSGSTLQTLLPSHELTIKSERSTEPDTVSVDDVDVVVPGLYFGENIAFHGLKSILDLRFQNRSVHRGNLPRMDAQSNRNDLSPVTEPLLDGNLPRTDGQNTWNDLSPETSPLLDGLLPESDSTSSSPGLNSLDKDYGNPASPSAPPFSYASISPVISSPGNDLGEDSEPVVHSDPGVDYQRVHPEFPSPELNSSNTMSPESGKQESPTTSPLSYTSPSPVEVGMLDGATSLPVNELGGHSESGLDSDPVGDYGGVATDQCENCGLIVDDSSMSGGRIPAAAPNFSWSSDGKRIDGRDL